MLAPALVAPVELFPGAAELAAQPSHASPVPEGTDVANAYAGAALQRLPMTPQGEALAAVLEAKRPTGMPLYSQVTVQIPRRATKTTSIQNVLLGRCLNIPGYVVVSTAQDGTRASEFISDLMDLIEDHAREVQDERNAELEDAHDGEGEPPEVSLKDALAELGIRQLYRSQGREYIRFTNGSKWKAVPPEPSKLRGKGVACVWFDEAGELDPAGSTKLMAGALPMLDTKPDGQVIRSGTPGEVRAGGFWEALVKARAAPDRFGIVDYSADEFADPSDESTWWATHPGLACGLTTIDVIRERFDGLGPDAFKMEYLCVWPADGKTAALDQRKFELTERPPKLQAPPEFALAFDIDPGGAAGAVAAAWLDDDRNPWVQVMRYRGGTSGWMEDYLARGLATFPRALLGFDSIGQNVAMADALRRKPRVRSAQVKALTMKDVGAGTAIFAQALENMNLHHAAHPGLTAAARSAQWRESGGTRLFRSGGLEVVTLRAAVAALALANKARERRPEAEQGTGLPRVRVL